MRTTLTLDPDVARLIEEEQHRQRKPFKEVVNEAIRRGLSPRTMPRDEKRYRVVPHRTELRPGFDPAGFNRLVDQMDEAAFLSKHSRPRR